MDLARHRLLHSKPLNIFAPHRKQLVGALLLLFWFSTSWALVALPKLSGHVVDLTASLSSEQALALDAKLSSFEAQKGSQIAVLIIPTTEPKTLPNLVFASQTAGNWVEKKIDDGVILIVAKNDRKLRLEVGYGLEGVLPDAIAKRIIAETMTPFFKVGDFTGGINAGVSQIIHLLNGESLPPPLADTAQQTDESLSLFILIGGVIAGWVLSAILGKTTGGMLAALGSGIAGALFLNIGIALFIAFMVFFFVGTRHVSGGWSSGGGFGGGGFGGGGGSWGGGGGGFGGGGASGSW